MVREPSIGTLSTRYQLVPTRCRKTEQGAASVIARRFNVNKRVIPVQRWPTQRKKATKSGVPTRTEISRHIRAIKPAEREIAASEKTAIPVIPTIIGAMGDLNSRPLPCERSDPEPERTTADEDGSRSNGIDVVDGYLTEVRSIDEEGPKE